MVHGLALDNALNRAREHAGNRSLLNLFHLDNLLVIGTLHRVGDDKSFEAGLFNAITSGTIKETVRDEGVDLGGAGLLELAGGLAQSATRVDHVIDDDAILALDVTDKVHTIHLIGLGAVLDHDSELGVVVTGIDEVCLELLSAHDTTGVRGDNRALGQVLCMIGLEMLDADREGLQVVDGDARGEETLDLAAVEIDGDHAVNAHGLQETGNLVIIKSPIKFRIWKNRKSF